MSEDLKIRPATMDEAEALARLADQWGYPTAAEVMAGRLAALLADANHAVFVAEVPEAGAVGWVHVQGELSLGSEPYADLGGLVVDEAHRGEGIGRALVSAAEAWARVHGYDTLKVRSNTKRPVALDFYEALGYTLTKTQNVFAKRLDG